MTLSEQLFQSKPSSGIFGWSRDIRAEYELRMKHIKLYGYAVLTCKVIELLRKYAPYVEIGAGTGYWTYELNKAGIDSIATDPYPHIANPYAFKDTKPYVSILPWDAVKSAKASAGRRNLLTVWPCYAHPWAYDALCVFKGQTVVYVGEGHGGCTADDKFHELLDEEWNQIDGCSIPQFSGIHDRLYVYQRKENAQ